MKKFAKKIRKVLSEYGDDIAYLLLTGLPFGLFLILLGKVIELGEVY